MGNVTNTGTGGWCFSKLAITRSMAVSESETVMVEQGQFWVDRDAPNHGSGVVMGNLIQWLSEAGRFVMVNDQRQLKIATTACAASSSANKKAHRKIRTSVLCGTEWKRVRFLAGKPGKSKEKKIPCDVWPVQIKLFNGGNNGWCFTSLSLKMGSHEFPV